MSLTILNSVSSLTAENALSSTQANLQKTLNQLSTGLRINSGSDDAAGLSIATGMQANMAALTQSQQNASNGIGMLQTADGALSQTTTLLNRAVTLATEAANTGITTGANSQAAALDGEFQSIMSEINQIGQTTNFNGQNVFASNAPTTFTSTQGSTSVPLVATAALTTSSNLTAGTTTSVTNATGTFSYTAKAGDTVQTLITALTSAAATTALGTAAAASITNGQLVVTDASTALTAGTTTDAQLGATANGTSTALTFAAGAVTTKNNAAGPTLTAGSVTTIQDSGTGGTFTFKAAAGESLTDLTNAISDAVNSGTLSKGVTATINGSGQLMISSNSSTDSIKVTSNDAALGTMNANSPSFVTSPGTAVTANSAIAASAVVTVNYANGKSTTYTNAASANTVGNLLTAITSGAAGSTGFTIGGSGAQTGTTAQINGSGEFEIDSANGDISSVSLSATSGLGTAMKAINGSTNTSTVYLSDGSGGSATTGSGNSANNTISTTINALSATALGLNSDNLQSTSAAQTALGDVTNAINAISAQRGVIGASVNRLTAASSNMSNTVTNLQSATDSIENADIGKTVANMTQYNVLQSTGMAALQQSNQAQQAVLKLVQ